MDIMCVVGGNSEAMNGEKWRNQDINSKSLKDRKKDYKIFQYTSECAHQLLLTRSYS